MPLRELASGGAAPTVDIVAVHGLNPRNKNVQDHAWDTWRKPPGRQGRLWLRDYLSNDLPDARIFLYEYDSAVLGSNKESFVDAGNTLLEWLRIGRNQDPRRPLLFICHSLGGLLVKQALVNAHANVFYRDVGSSVFSLVFFGTPHEGGNASLVRLGSTAAGIARNLGFGANESIVMALQSGSVFAGCLREAFRHQLGKYFIVSFWEGRGNVVSKQSATFGLPGIKENIVRLEADHRSMCKFDLSYPEDQDNYSLVKGNLLTIVANIRAHRTDVDESPLTNLDRDSLDAYYQQTRGRIFFPSVMALTDIEDNVSWVTATSPYRSWITDPKPNMPNPLRVLWCQTGDDTDRGHSFLSFFLLKDMSALFIDCRDIPSPPSKSSSNISTTVAGLAEMDRGAVQQKFGSRKSKKAPRSDKVPGIIWGLLIQSFMIASPVISVESFGRHVLTSMPPEDKRSGEELANLTALLSNSLATWAAKTSIILDHLEFLDNHELVQLDRAISQLLQYSRQARFMLLSKVIKPGSLRDNALLVDQDTAYRECSDTFYFKNMMQRRDHIATACIDTNHWLWSNPSYRAWATDLSVHALWIAGKPGSGKSVLARTIEDELTGKGGFETAIVSTWFYSIRDNLIHHSAMLSCLLFQMLQKEKRVFQLISKRYCEKRENDREIHWSFNELQEMFAEVVRDQSLDKPLFLVLDGIDESSLKGAEGECSRAKLLQFFLDTLQLAPTGRVKMIFLSRLEDDIRTTLRKLPSIIMHQVNSKDIEKVVDLGIQSILDELHLLEDSSSDTDDDVCMTNTAQDRGSSLFEQAERAQSELIQYIRGYLIDNADGIILWVLSVISHIQMQLSSAFCTLSQLAAEIEKLSTELSEVYITIVRNIAKAPGRSSTLALAQRALLWVRSNPALGKFYAQDLLEVLAIDQDQTGGRWATVTGWPSFHKQLTRLCGPFLEIVTKENGWNCGPYDPVQLLHQTVRAFLDDPRASAPLYLSIEESAKRFESDCMRYIQKTLPETPAQPHPLLAGATATLDEMIHDITTYLEDRPLLSFILTFKPNMASFIPVRYKEILKTLIMLPTFVGGLGIDSIRKLFYEACKSGRANAICSLFAISSHWLHTWEWYLIEPEIIEGSIQAAKEVSAETHLGLHRYISCREILPRIRSALDSKLATREHVLAGHSDQEDQEVHTSIRRPSEPDFNISFSPPLAPSASVSIDYELTPLSPISSPISSPTWLAEYASDALNVDEVFHPPSDDFFDVFDAFPRRVTDESPQPASPLEPIPAFLGNNIQPIPTKQLESLEPFAINYTADPTSAEVERASTSTKLAGSARVSPDVVRAVNEVLSFWEQLAGSPELQTPEAFRGAKEPHFSECPDIAWRMAIIRATVLDSKRRSERAYAGRRLKRGSNFQVSGGLRVAAQDVNAATSPDLLYDSPLSDALSKIEEAPSRDGPASLSVFVWQENLRRVIVSSDAYEASWNEHKYFFNELPPILPSVFPQDHGTVAGEFAHANSSGSGSAFDPEELPEELPEDLVHISDLTRFTSADPPEATESWVRSTRIRGPWNSREKSVGQLTYNLEDLP